ncbi:MAG: family 5 extracellular solute-binding protein [Acidimicrobiaceae bacterium]|nr:family 5 extracellular solute-binding protein [Acidimicrobiaceae bacterium]
MREIFEYRFTKLDPVGGDHIDPPGVAIYEGLLNKGPSEQPLPGLAVAWSPSEDGLVWRLRLRPEARFHSGDPCDAPAVVAALERCRWGDGRTHQLWYWDPVDTVRALDEGTIEIRLHYPWLRLPTLLWGTHTAIANDRRREALGARYGIELADGTGPYRLVSYEPDEVVGELVHGAGETRPRVVSWMSESDDDARCAALGRDDVDVVRAVRPEWIQHESAERWRYVEQDEISQFYLALRFDGAFGFDDVELRRAVDAFVDRPALVAAAFGGLGNGRRSPVPVGDVFASNFDPATVPPLSIAQAEAVLDAHGLVRGPDGVRMKDGVPLRLPCVTQDAPAFRRLVGELGRQIAAAGIVLEFEYYTPFEDFYRACAKRPAAFVSKWLWQDAIEAVMGFSRSSCTGDAGCNWQGSIVPAVDAAYDRFLQASTLEELGERSREVQESFMRELPYIPLCSPAETYAISPRVHGFVPVPGTLYPLYDKVLLADE